MTQTKWRRHGLCIGAVLFAIFIQVINDFEIWTEPSVPGPSGVQHLAQAVHRLPSDSPPPVIDLEAERLDGYEELYTISHLSPKSLLAEDLNINSPLERTKRENLAFNIEPSIYDGPEADIEAFEEEELEQHVIVERSADPMGDREQRSINIDEIPSSNNNEIDNELELHHKRKYYEIHPTKTIDHLQDRGDFIFPSEGFGDRLDFRFPGEGQRVPKQRALPPTGPKIQPSAVQPIYATATPRDQARQHSAELQNIITEIVKRLNGNVNVQANSQLLNGRPGRPMNSRINNRGPPRIAEAPLLPDIEVNPVTPYIPTRSPPPYPFDRPPYHGVNLPEQIVPPAPYRPGFHRPNLPPWHRPRPRPTPSRRPNPNLPIYKPTTPVSVPNVDLSEDDLEDILTLNDHEINTVKEPTDNISSNEKDPNSTLAGNTTEIQQTSDPDQSPDTNATEPVSEPSTESSTKSSTTSTTTTEKPVTQATTEKPTEKTTQITTTSEKPKTTTEKVKEKPSKPEKEKKKDSVLEKEKPKDKYKLTEDKVNTTTNKTKNETVDFHIEPSMAEKVQSSSVAIPTERLPTIAPVTEKSTDVSNAAPPVVNTKPLPAPPGPYAPYRPRPGIVLDDTDFKPHGTRQPYREAAVITAVDTRLPDGYGEIFDVTVSAIQGPGEKTGATVHIQNVNPATGHAESDDIIVSPSGEQGFVSIDGKRTYLNLFGESSTVHQQQIQPTRVLHRPLQSPPPQIDTGVAGVAIPTDDVPQTPQRRPAPSPSHGGRPQQPYRRPQPTVRIDTCIVGDDSTCDHTQNEKCRTEAGISSCQCRPGYARRAPRSPCRRVVALVLNLRVDRLYDRKVAWDLKLADKESEPYQQLSYEALRAIDSAFSMTPFSDDFVGGTVNAIHNGDQNNQGVFVNYTILMQESPETVRSAISVDIQRHLLGVIRRRSNNVGASALWVDTPAGSVPPPTDLDECSTTDLNDCHKLATCTNTWGGFRCVCPQTTKDPNLGDISRVGRECHTCANSHCNDRGTCYYANSLPYCSCSSGYYGSQCEVDGEVVGVAVGASLVAALVIALTLAALLSWSRKWSREQKAAGMGSPVFNYMAANTIKTPPVGQPPYQIPIEERMRWAQIAEAMAANHYAQADAAQTMAATRPSSALFGGYPTLPPVPMPRTTGMYSHHGTLNTVTSRANTAASHHNMYAYTNHAASESTSSEASSHVQERADLLVPRPKSRARSMHNQNGIYYDVEYENTPEAIYGTKGIPLSTYTMSRGPPFYR